VELVLLDQKDLILKVDVHNMDAEERNEKDIFIINKVSTRHTNGGFSF
jgi:hypothetical protein